MTQSISRRDLLCLACFAATLVGAAESEPVREGVPRTLALSPLGAVLPAQDVAFVQASLAAFYELRVEQRSRTDLPRSAYYAPRKRYRAEKLLEFLESTVHQGEFRILGLTASDISTSKGELEDWGILGLASLDGTACVLSSFRCGRRSRGATHARERLGKVAVHEVGHTLGLEHCPNRGCLMEDAGGSVLTCDREYELCADCRQHLSTRGYLASAPGAIPWPPPLDR